MSFIARFSSRHNTVHDHQTSCTNTWLCTPETGLSIWGADPPLHLDPPIHRVPSSFEGCASHSRPGIRARNYSGYTPFHGNPTVIRHCTRNWPALNSTYSAHPPALKIGATYAHEQRFEARGPQFCSPGTHLSVQRTDPPSHPNPPIRRVTSYFGRHVSCLRPRIRPRITVNTRLSNGIQYFARNRPAVNPIHLVHSYGIGNTPGAHAWTGARSSLPSTGQSTLTTQISPLYCETMKPRTSPLRTLQCFPPGWLGHSILNQISHLGSYLPPPTHLRLPLVDSVYA